MSNLIALSSKTHAAKGFTPRDGYNFAKTQNIVPILLAELNKLVTNYPLAFIAAEDHYIAVALIGIGPKNLYVNQDGKWLSSYVPSGVRGFPFSLAKDDKDRRIFCIHEEYISDDATSPRLFTSDGELTAETKSHFDFLTHCETNRIQTQAAVETLQAAALLTPWDLTLTDAKSQGLALKGLFRINEKALNALPAEIFAGLRETGALALAYAQMFSMSQHIQLTERLKYHTSLTGNSAVRTKTESASILSGDDILQFDF